MKKEFSNVQLLVNAADDVITCTTPLLRDYQAYREIVPQKQRFISPQMDIGLTSAHRELLNITALSIDWLAKNMHTVSKNRPCQRIRQ